VDGPAQDDEGKQAKFAPSACFGARVAGSAFSVDALVIGWRALDRWKAPGPSNGS
jgi:hypothetical protein